MGGQDGLTWWLIEPQSSDWLLLIHATNQLTDCNVAVNYCFQLENSVVLVNRSIHQMGQKCPAKGLSSHKKYGCQIHGTPGDSIMICLHFGTKSYLCVEIIKAILYEPEPNGKDRFNRCYGTSLMHCTFINIVGKSNAWLKSGTLFYVNYNILDVSIV